jgi:hypothetical protein
VEAAGEAEGLGEVGDQGVVLQEAAVGVVAQALGHGAGLGVHRQAHAAEVIGDQAVGAGCSGAGAVLVEQHVIRHVGAGAVDVAVK